MLTAKQLREALEGVSDNAAVILRLPRGFRSHSQFTTLCNLKITHSQNPILRLEILDSQPSTLAFQHDLAEAVCCVIRNKEDPTKILLVSRKDDPENFGLPGGKVDPNDTGLRAALEREVKEETGLEVTLAEEPIFARECLRHAPEGQDFYAYAYVAMDYQGEPQSQESGVLKWGTWEDQESGTFADYNRGVQAALQEVTAQCRDYGGNCGGCDICCPDDELWK